MHQTQVLRRMVWRVNVDLATRSSRPTLLGSHLGRRSQPSTCFLLLVWVPECLYDGDVS